MDLASTGGSPNHHKITDYGGWGRVNIKIGISTGKSFAKYKLNTAS